MRKESEQRTYLIAAVMSSIGITSMAIASIYYRFSWQMERLGGLSYFTGIENKDERVLVPDLGSLSSIHDREDKWITVRSIARILGIHNLGKSMNKAIILHGMNNIHFILWGIPLVFRLSGYLQQMLADKVLFHSSWFPSL
ncbi:beta-carotene hydroxylase 1 [Canna indica]|uniref:beta-carotene 3-hydroxylase n=1 Tax=Canna indica TaxID=4628 RepID=A0AAQ3KDJ8_9LILI|nr:beta-carotene hydroxylase 1 [Canna indica]